MLPNKSCLHAEDKLTNQHSREREMGVKKEERISIRHFVMHPCMLALGKPLSSARHFRLAYKDQCSLHWAEQPLTAAWCSSPNIKLQP